ncbi:MAG: hypothetical protein EZS28_014898 [Streblomastix strix]|uniref:Uncharacterized protein n=1 Tax=Streblomastix strix TaxID=222440 RepID=A0A5J4W419_9EUKA|nr:MAG: hypothetical protein EZS28_014898 [Streblomastix strix]
MNQESQRKILTDRSGPKIELNKTLNILNAMESGTEEANINVLRLSIGEGLPFESILAQNSGRNIALGNVVALLFELLLSPIQQESNEALNLLKEGIKKREDFKIACHNN